MHNLYQKHPVADFYKHLRGWWSSSKTQPFKGPDLHQPGLHFANDNYSEAEQCSDVSFRTFSWETVPFAASMHIYHETEIMEILRITNDIVHSFSSLQISFFKRHYSCMYLQATQPVNSLKLSGI